MNHIKASETQADLHGNTVIKPGDWVAIGQHHLTWGRVVRRSDEKVTVATRSLDKWFVADIVDYAPREVHSNELYD